MGRLKLIIKPFDSGWNYILYLSFKLIPLLVIWSWKCNNALKKEITSLRTLATQVCWLALDVFPWWISKHRIWRHKNHSKTSNGAGRFAHILRACKISQYNVRNYKSGRHNRRHIFGHHNTLYKPLLTNIPYYGLKAKERKNRKSKIPSPCKQNLMLCALNLCQDAGNNHLLMDSGYDDHSYINFLFRQGLNQVDSSTNLLDKVILTEVVTWPKNNNGV